LEVQTETVEDDRGDYVLSKHTHGSTELSYGALRGVFNRPKFLEASLPGPIVVSPWEGADQLKFERGLDRTIAILDEYGLTWFRLGRSVAILWRDVVTKMSRQERQAFNRQRRIRRKSSREEEISFVVALWVAGQHSEMSPVWIAAMAQDAFLQTNLYAAGYLIALLEQKERADHHVARGTQQLKGASKGGHARAAALTDKTNRILQAMRPLVKDGHSASRAGAIVYNRDKLGSSGGANAKLFKRHQDS
jgi:hypothetical protein